MGLTFEWDRRKAAASSRKHGVGFDEAATAFGDPFSLTIPDPDHSGDEDRFILLGETWRGRLVVVVHTLRGDNVRLVTARLATGNERHIYEQGQEG